MPTKKTTKGKTESERRPRLPDAGWTRAVTVGEVTRDTLPADFCERTTLPDSRVVEAPPKSPRSVTVVADVSTSADERIAALVGERLAGSKAFDDHPIELRVNEGEVELRGVVGWEADRFEAEHLASSVRGVVRVVNHLLVQTQPVERVI